MELEEKGEEQDEEVEEEEEEEEEQEKEEERFGSFSLLARSIGQRVSRSVGRLVVLLAPRI